MKKQLLLLGLILSIISNYKPVFAASITAEDESSNDKGARPISSLPETPLKPITTQVDSGAIWFCCCCPCVSRQASIKADINTSVSRLSLNCEDTLEEGKVTTKRYDFYIISQSGKLERLGNIGSEDRNMVVPSYYKLLTEPIIKKPAKDLSSIKLITATPFTSTDGSVTKTMSTTIQFGAEVKGGGAGAGGGVTAGLSHTLTTSYNIKDVVLYQHPGSNAAIDWEYKLNNLGKNDNVRSNLQFSHKWIWQVDHEEAKKERLYRKLAGSNDDEYFLDFETTLNVAYTYITKRPDFATYLGFAEWGTKEICDCITGTAVDVAPYSSRPPFSIPVLSGNQVGSYKSYTITNNEIRIN